MGDYLLEWLAMITLLIDWVVYSANRYFTSRRSKAFFLIEL